MVDPVGTHLPVLLYLLNKTDGPILELGAGEFSTRQIHLHAKSHITTVETNIHWMIRYADLASDNHKFLLLGEPECYMFHANDKEHYGLVFIDSINWELREHAIKNYSKQADYIIIHDADFGKKIMSFDFKYKSEYKQDGLDSPTVMIASNFYEVDFEIEGMIKL